MDRTTFFAYVLPFVEQNALYERFISLPNGLGQDLRADNGTAETENWHSTISGAAYEDFRNGLCLIPTYYCPTRRSASKMATKGQIYTANDWNQRSNRLIGPATDYVLVGIFLTSNPADSIPNYFKDSFFNADRNQTSAQEATLVERDRSPFRAVIMPIPATGTLSDKEKGEGKPRDTMAWWADGTSNQFIISEKQIPMGQLYETVADGPWLYSQGNNVYIGRQRHFYGGVEKVDYNVGRAPSFPDDWRRHGIGSWHPGVCNVLLGDGAVRSIPIVSNETVLLRLSHVNDGVVVELP